MGASPLGSPNYTSEMLSFASKHNVEPVIEKFKMSEVNQAIDKLANGKPKYRIVLEASI